MGKVTQTIVLVLRDVSGEAMKVGVLGGRGELGRVH